MNDSLRPGDMAEVAVWLTGTETEQQLLHWKTQICEQVKRDTEEQYHVSLGPWHFTEKQVGDDRVPPVPDYIKGPDVRLLVAEAKVGPGRARPPIKIESGFVHDLTKEDLQKLRALTRKFYAKQSGGVPLTDKDCDQIIEALGPEAALKTLRGDDGPTFH